MFYLKVKMAFWMRMQNFIFIENGGLFWTSASLTPWQRLMKWIKGEKELCNTSAGETLPFHGQWILYQNGDIVFDNGYIRKVYSPTLKLNKYEPSKSLRAIEIMTLPGAIGNGALQGVEYKGRENQIIHTVFGSTGTDDITILTHIRSRKELVNTQKLSFETFKKRRFKSWEAEGIRQSKGNLFIGVCFKTWYFTKENYLIKVK